MNRASLWIAFAFAGLVAVPAFAADNTGDKDKPMGNMPMKHTEMHKPVHHAVVRHRASHKMNCSDYAWQSQDMKDCMAKSGKSM
jgi:hypothetical protein